MDYRVIILSLRNNGKVQLLKLSLIMEEYNKAGNLRTM